MCSPCHDIRHFFRHNIGIKKHHIRNKGGHTQQGRTHERRADTQVCPYVILIGVKGAWIKMKYDAAQQPTMSEHVGSPLP